MREGLRSDLPPNGLLQAFIPLSLPRSRSVSPSPSLYDERFLKVLHPREPPLAGFGCGRENLDPSLHRLKPCLSVALACQERCQGDPFEFPRRAHAAGRWGAARSSW